MTHLIPSDYRTSTVCCILSGMEQRNDYSHTPHLVDAMRDAGAPDAAIRHVLLGCVCAAPEQNTAKLLRGPATTVPNNIDDTTCLYEDGYISEITCSWQDFLVAAPSLLWSPGMTDEVPSGICHCGEECESHDWGSGHSPVDMPDRIPRPLPETAQPVELVRLTTVPWPDPSQPNPHPEYRWTREKCPTCNGVNYTARRCPNCHGTPLNRWRCGEWPSTAFEMP